MSTKQTWLRDRAAVALRRVGLWAVALAETVAPASSPPDDDEAPLPQDPVTPEAEELLFRPGAVVGEGGQRLDIRQEFRDDGDPDRAAKVLAGSLADRRRSREL